MDVSIGTPRGANQLSISRNQWGILKRSYINSFYTTKFLTHKKGHPDIRVITQCWSWERYVWYGSTLWHLAGSDHSQDKLVDLCATAWDFYIPFKSNKFFLKKKLSWHASDKFPTHMKGLRFNFTQSTDITTTPICCNDKGSATGRAIPDPD